jgi:hypothetical protein
VKKKPQILWLLATKKDLQNYSLNLQPLHMWTPSHLARANDCYIGYTVDPKKGAVPTRIQEQGLWDVRDKLDLGDSRPTFSLGASTAKFGLVFHKDG